MSSFRTFRNVAEGWLNYMRFLVSRQGHSSEMAKVAEDRMSYCVPCEHLKVDEYFGGLPAKGKCTKCGCFYPVFLYAPLKSCPVGKWPARDDIKDVRHKVRGQDE